MRSIAWHACPSRFALPWGRPWRRLAEAVCSLRGQVRGYFGTAGTGNGHYTRVSKISLVVGQDIPGNTTHQLFVHTPTGWVFLTTFSGYTQATRS
jgi:hypothetical protein